MGRGGFTKVVIVGLLALAGCAAPFTRAEKKPGSGVLYVYRPYKFVAGAFNFGASLTEVGTNRTLSTFRVRMDKYVAVDVPAGQHMLAIAGVDGKATVFPISMSDGGEVAIRCEITGIGAHATCTSPPLPAAFEEIKKTRHNVNGD